MMDRINKMNETWKRDLRGWVMKTLQKKRVFLFYPIPLGVYVKIKPSES